MVRAPRSEPTPAGGTHSLRWHHLLLVAVIIVMLSLLCATP